eukprot:1161625-Pelagomonas_calceolata.AAC.10
MDTSPQFLVSFLQQTPPDQHREHCGDWRHVAPSLCSCINCAHTSNPTKEQSEHSGHLLKIAPWLHVDSEQANMAKGVAHHSRKIEKATHATSRG